MCTRGIFTSVVVVACFSLGVIGCGGGGSGAEAVNELAPVHPAAADFSAKPTTGQVPLTVSFTNESNLPGAHTADYFWDFGDGQSSTEENPVHVYTAAGTFTVSLMVTTAPGADTAVGTIIVLSSHFGGGTEFVLAFQENNNFEHSLSFFISSQVVTSGEIYISGLGIAEGFDLVPGTAKEFDIPTSAIVFGSDATTQQGVEVFANDPIVVYGLNHHLGSTDGFTGLPVNALGTEHFVMSSIAASGGVKGSQFAVVATQDDTTVTITPTVSTGARTGDVPDNDVLNRLDVYQLQSDGTDEDLTGTYIASNKPVALFSGVECGNIPDNDAEACDHLVEQIPHVGTWGTEVITVPLATRLGGDTFRILAAEDATSVTVAGPSGQTFFLNRGQFALRTLAGINRITSNRPILVAQFSNGSRVDGVLGDPFMMILIPQERFLPRYTFFTPYEHFSGDFAANFINVIAPTVDVSAGGVLLDGTPLSADLFTAVPGTGFSVRSVQVSSGQSHTIAATSPVGLYIYGFGSFDSYGFPGGMAF